MNVILADASVIEADSITLEPHIVKQAADWDAFNAVLDKLTPENLEVMEIYDGPVRVAGYTGVELIGTQTVNNYDGSMTAHFYFTGTPAESLDPAYKEAFDIITGGLE